MKFRVKAPEVEAIEIGELLSMVANAPAQIPEKLQRALRTGDVVPESHSLKIRTSIGTMVGHFHDWLIYGPGSEIYPVRPDIFDETYEEVR